MLDTANHLGVEIHDLDFDDASGDSQSSTRPRGKNKLLTLISTLGDEDVDAPSLDGDSLQVPILDIKERANPVEEAFPSEPFWQPSLSAMQLDKQRKRNSDKKEKRTSGSSLGSGRRRSNDSISEIRAMVDTMSLLQKNQAAVEEILDVGIRHLVSSSSDGIGGVRETISVDE